jgi:hypothetical protein
MFFSLLLDNLGGIVIPLTKFTLKINQIHCPNGRESEASISILKVFLFHRLLVCASDDVFPFRSSPRRPFASKALMALGREKSEINQ